jgi:hypothetical protein
MNLCCLAILLLNIFLEPFSAKKNQEETWRKIYLGQDPDPELDPDVFKNGIRIWSKIIQIFNTA